MRFAAALLAALTLAASTSAQQELNDAFQSARAGLRSGRIAGMPDAPQARPRPDRPEPGTISQALRAYLENLPPVDTDKHGRPDGPLTLVFIGSKPEIYRALRQAHWTGVPRSLPLSFAEGLGQLVTGRKITKFPPFHKFRVEGKTQKANWAVVVHALSSRHHFRLWRLKELDPYGREVWWGSASFDTGIRWKGIIPVTHNTSPDISAERDYIAKTLRGAPGVVTVSVVRLPQIPRRGENDQSEHFYTDGRVLVAEFSRPIPCARPDSPLDDQLLVREP